MDTSRTTERLAASVKGRKTHAVAKAGRALSDSQPAALRRARVLRPWRLALLAYAIVLTVATHWPRLQLAPEVPTSDKMIHMLAFGALTVLLWRSGLLGWHTRSPTHHPPPSLSGRGGLSIVITGFIALFWAALDEISQGIPILGRTVSWHDLLANACGVIAALALIWAMRPLQPTDQLLAPNRARARLLEFTFDDMFATKQPWIIALGMLVACAVTIALGRLLLPTPRSVGVFGLIVVIVALHVLYIIYRRIFFARFRRVLSEKPCLECGARVIEDDSAKRQVGDGDASDSGDCAVCGADRSVWNRPLPPRPPFRAVVEASIVPAIVALMGIVALFAIVLLAPVVYSWSIRAPGGATQSTAPRLAHIVGRLPRELNSVVDLTIYLLLISLVARMWRRRMAAYIDRGFRCRACGHDLQGTPVNQFGEGHCGECGEAFRR